MKITLIFLSASAFIFYGFLILISNHMKKEFKRYKMEKFRTLTGYLEFFGGIGQIMGLTLPSLLIFSSTGLATLMFLGVIIRIRTKDTFLEIIPAILLMLINIYIVVSEIL